MKNIVPKGVMIRPFLSEACATSFPISNPNKINVVAAIGKRRARDTPEITHSPPPHPQPKVKTQTALCSSN